MSTAFVLNPVAWRTGTSPAQPWRDQEPPQPSPVQTRPQEPPWFLWRLPLASVWGKAPFQGLQGLHNMDTHSNRSHPLLLGTEVNGAHMEKETNVLPEQPVNHLASAWVEK